MDLNCIDPQASVLNYCSRNKSNNQSISAKLLDYFSWRNESNINEMIKRERERERTQTRYL